MVACGHDHHTSAPSKIVLEGDVVAMVEVLRGHLQMYHLISLQFLLHNGSGGDCRILHAEVLRL